jgi:hypothetical protein
VLTLATECNDVDNRRTQSTPTAFTPQLQSLLANLGMRKDTFPSYSILHENPVIPLVVLQAGNATIAMTMVLICTGIPLRRFFYSIPALVSTILATFFALSSWHFGPFFMERPGYKILVLISSVAHGAVTIMGQAGPIKYVPFGSPIQFLVVLIVQTVASNFVLATGALQKERPAQPMRGIVPLMTRAMVLSARIMDTLTDMSFFRILDAEVLPIFYARDACARTVLSQRRLDWDVA